MNKVHVKTGDTVVILSGKDKGKKGKVLEVSPKEGKVIVEGLNIATKHVKPRRQGEQGGIVEAEAAMYASKVQAALSAASQQESLISSLRTVLKLESARTQTAAKNFN